MAFIQSLTGRTVLPGLVLVSLLAYAGCGSGNRTADAEAKDVVCTTGQARLETIPGVVTATGNLEADRSVTVSTRMMGWVKKIHVTEGLTVCKGDPLLSIDDTDLRARKSQAEAGIAEATAVLTNAQTMLDRFERLYADKSVSKARLDDVRTGRDRAAAGLKMAQAGLREVNVHLSYLDIVAPADGVVARKMVEEGDMASPGQPLLVLEQTGLIKAVAHLGEKDITAVKVGDMVDVAVSSVEGAVFHVPLTKVIPTANPGSRTYDIEALLDNAEGRLHSGMFARMTLRMGTRTAVTAPSAAIIRRGQLTGVWVVGDDDRAHLRWVRLGRNRDDSVEVLAGLDGNETVVLSSRLPLAEGDKVVK